jgi:hypothetical protein
MQQILDSETSPANPPKTSTEAAILEALAAFSADTGGAATLRALQKRDPQEFAWASIHVLASGEPSPGLKVVAELVAAAGRIENLLLQAEVPIPMAAAALKGLSVADPLFEIRMIRKVIHAYGEVGSIPPGVALRLLKILDKTSDCSRLTNHLVQFVRHPSQHVRSKSVLLMGRGNVNLNRTKEYLLSPVPRVRANAVESIWDHPDAAIRKTLEECARDSSQRVAVNALVGLCRLGDMEASRRLAGMAKAEDPVARAGAAWGMGNVNRPEMAAEFKAVLELLARDPDSKVADMARRSLEALAVGQVPDLPAKEDISGKSETSPVA